MSFLPRNRVLAAVQIAFLATLLPMVLAYFFLELKPEWLGNLLAQIAYIPLMPAGLAMDLIGFGPPHTIIPLLFLVAFTFIFYAATGWLVLTVVEFRKRKRGQL